MSKRKPILWLISLSSLSFLLTVGTLWFPTLPHHFLVNVDSGTFLLPLVLLIAAASIPFTFGRLIVGRTHSGIYLITALMVIAASLVGFPIGRQLRMNEFKSLAERSFSLVDAIREYQQSNGELPQSLDALVPKFIDAIPTTGMAGFPKYEYYVGADAEEYGGNPWALEVFTPGPGINFDRFIYYPDQNYPEFAHGGSLERIGDWAYVHE